jgi:acyl-[acyl carrier protein]--UDP-N-acetylglucosamine O-acyltransferase
MGMKLNLRMSQALVAHDILLENHLLMAVEVSLLSQIAVHTEID